MDEELTKEISDTQKTALIIWDVQKALVEGIFNTDEFLANVEALINSARQKNIPVFFTKITPLPERFESVSRKFFTKKRKFNFSPGGLDLALIPDKEDFIISKNTASIFVGTNFEQMAHNAGIKTLIFTGIATEIGVESSARDALNRGFFAVVAKDAVSSRSKENHERSLANMENLAMLMATSEILKMWS